MGKRGIMEERDCQSFFINVKFYSKRKGKKKKYTSKARLVREAPVLA